MSNNIHPSAVIEDGACVGEDCSIGPFCYLGPKVRIGNGCVLQSHVVIDGDTILGDHNTIFSFACLGKQSQDLKYQGEDTYVRIGSGNTFREYTTINAATQPGSATTVGDNCHILSYSHIAHDCVLANHIILSSSVFLAGHVIMDDYAICSGFGGAIQFVHIGKGAFIGGFSKLTHDLLPYVVADGNPATARAVNKVGLERRGLDAATIRAIHTAFKTILRSGLTVEEAAEKLRNEYPDVAQVQEMVDFALASKGLARPRTRSS